MSKYSEKIKSQICKLIEEDTYTIPEICKNVGIAERTFHKWKNEISEFSEAIEQATKNRNEKFAQTARKSLLKKISGFDVTETKITHTRDKKTGEMVEKEVVKTTKRIIPDTSALIFALTNTDSSNWSTRTDKMSEDKERAKIVITIPDNGRDRIK